MTNLSAGEWYYDTAIDMELVVEEDVNTSGMSTAEMDAITVLVTFESGETFTVPHERFRGRQAYQRVDGGA